MKTVLITGCSSGFGAETARRFLKEGWNVVATMRTPRNDVFEPSERLRIMQLDVTDEASTAHVVQSVPDLDVLVNNAGVGLMGVLESTPEATIRTVFETNTLGTIAMTRAILPQFRARRAGIIVNVSSTVTLLTLPFLAVYTASKAAVNAFTESLALELRDVGVRVALVLPGASPETAFRSNAYALAPPANPPEYDDFKSAAFAALTQPRAGVTTAKHVSDAVWQVVNDPKAPMRTLAGDDARALANASGC